MTQPDRALFGHFPALAGALPHRSVAELPTPVDLHPGADLGLNCAGLAVKRDDASSPLYGGNKVRKLEFLLADALERGCRAVATFGVAGSNHALATAIHARRLGLEAYSLLTHQSNAAYVARNLLAGHTAGAHLVAFDSEEAAAAGARRLVREGEARDAPVCVIPGGGSSPLGALGFVSAALELADQVAAGLLPAPELIYVALGTTGTVAGLMLGLALAGLDTEVVAVRVVREDIGSPSRILALQRGAARLLAPGVPGLDGDYEGRLPTLRHEFLGPGYARFTPEGVAAIAWARARLGIRLEGTYTGKACAALLADAGAGRLAGRQVLFWDTYSPAPAATAADYRDLPRAFHGYFERPVQPLDPEGYQSTR